jgi:hypothetical protein
MRSINLFPFTDMLPLEVIPGIACVGVAPGFWDSFPLAEKAIMMRFLCHLAIW